jgi:hypothetical protein
MELVLWVPGDPPENLLIAAAAAGDLSKVREQIANGISVNSIDTRYKQTALHAACDRGQKKVVTYLLKAGPDIDVLDGLGMTPLMHACSSGHSDIALLLTNAGADVAYERAGDEMSALKFALWGRCSPKLLRLLREKGAKLPDATFRIVHLEEQGTRSTVPGIRKWMLYLFLGGGFLSLAAVIVILILDSSAR